MKRIFYLLAIFLLLGCNKTDEKQVGANNSENKISSAGNISTQQLEKIMSTDTIGIQREYFDKNYGPAKRSFGNIWKYEIGTCSVSIEYNQKNSITSVELENISKECNFNGKNINLASMADKINYAELINVAMDWNAKLSCYTSCGNAADPEYGAHIETARVYGNIEFEATTNYAEASEASDKVKEYFGKKYPNVDLIGDQLGTIPKEEYNKIWFEKFKNIKLTAIKFGYNLKE